MENLQLSNLALHHLIEELNYFENGFVNNIQTLDNNWIKMKVHTKEFGDKQLILAPNAIFASSQSLQAKQSPGGFSAFLKKFLYNQRMVTIKQHGLDRIIQIDFPECKLIIELFAKGNLILCDKNNKILRAFRKEEWKDRKLEQDEEYKFPSSRGISPLEENEKSFFEKLKKSEKTLFGSCVDILNVSPQILELVFSNEKIDKLINAKEVTQKNSINILTELKKIYSSKQKKAYLIGNNLFTTDLGTKDKEFESINFAVNSLLLEQLQETPKKGDENKNDKKQDKDLKNLKSRQMQLDGINIQLEETQKKGEEIYLHYTELKELISAINKAKEKNISEKEIMEKVNKLKPLIKELDFKKKKLIVTLN